MDKTRIKNIILKVLLHAPIGPREGFAAHKIPHGRRPRTRKTDRRIPHKRNHFLAFCPIVDKMSALMIALSILAIDSKMNRPITMITA